MSNEEKIISILEEHSKKFDQINQKLDTHDEDIRSMKSSIINIEVQVTEKIPALFDAITVNLNKHEIYDDAISSLNAKTFNHNIRIEALEDTLKDLSVSA